LKSDVPADLSKRPKKDASAPTPTLISELAVTHGCGLSMSVMVAVKSAEASTFRKTVEEAMPCSALSPTSICGIRWAVASNVAPTSDSGPGVIVTSVLRIFSGIDRGGKERGDDREHKEIQGSRLLLGLISTPFDPSWCGKTKEAPLRS
jgi:hypothetical protein